MVQIQLRYEGGLRCRATHGPSGQTLFTDAPLDNQGKGESFSPTDLVGAALGACMLTIMGIVAERHGWHMEGSEVTVDKGMVADPARRIGSLAVKIHVHGEFDERARETLEKAALTCPVHKSLRADMQLPVSFVWDTARSAH